MKKSISILLTAAIVLSFVGCSANTGSKRDRGSSSEGFGSKVDSDDEGTGWGNTGNQSSQNNSSDSNSDSDSNTSVAIEEVRVGDTISLPFVTFRIDSFEVSSNGYEFESSSSSNGINVTNLNSLEPSNSQVSLVCLRGEFTNNSGGDRFPSNNPMYGVMTINGSEYNMQMDCFIIEDAESQLTLINGLPVDCFFYAEVPNSIASNLGTCQVTFGFQENMEASYISGVDDLDYLYSFSGTPTNVD